MAKEERHKETICATVSPYIRKQIERLVEAKEFSSMSDLVSIAVTEFIAKYSQEERTRLERKAAERVIPEEKGLQKEAEAKAQDFDEIVRSLKWKRKPDRIIREAISKE